VVAAAAAAAEVSRLRLPAFEWYLGPAYQRYGEILADRARANTGQEEKKKSSYRVPPELPWIKHTHPRICSHTFGDALFERPLEDQSKIHCTLPSTPRHREDAGTGRLSTPRKTGQMLGMSMASQASADTSGGAESAAVATPAQPRRKLGFA